MNITMNTTATSCTSSIIDLVSDFEQDPLPEIKKATPTPEPRRTVKPPTLQETTSLLAEFEEEVTANPRITYRELKELKQTKKREHPEEYDESEPEPKRAKAEINYDESDSESDDEYEENDVLELIEEGEELQMELNIRRLRCKVEEDSTKVILDHEAQKFNEVEAFKAQKLMELEEQKRLSAQQQFENDRALIREKFQCDMMTKAMSAMIDKEITKEEFNSIFSMKFLKQ